MGRLFVPIGLLAAIVIAIIATDRPAPRADFTFINRGDVATLDVQKASWMQDLRVIRLLFEGLVKNDIFDPDYTPMPGVAERWEISDDGLVYTFHLRADAVWNVGGKAVPVTAHDFAYAWRRGILPDTASDYAGQFHLIRGARAFADWRTKQLDEIGSMADGPEKRERARALWPLTERMFSEMVGVRAVDDRTFRVELERPTPYFLDLCAFAVFYPVYPPLVNQYELPDPTTGRLDQQPGWTMAANIVCNGPFTLKAWRFKREMRFEKNEHYWDRDSIAIDSVSIPSNEDPNAQVLAFQSGAVDWVSDVTPPYRRFIVEDKQKYYAENAEAYRALVEQGLDPVEIDRRLPPDPRKNIHTFPAFGTYFYNFNCQPRLVDGRDNPFADPRVRRAFAMAIDKERIATKVRGTGERVANTLIPRNAIAGYESPAGLEYDPAGARKLLAEAGYPDGKGFITVEILFNKDSGHDLIAQAAAKDWQENLGVPVLLAQKEVKVFRNDLKNQNFMISRAGWFGDYGDPTTFLDLNRCDDGNNDRKYCSPKYEELMDRAADEPDAAKRLAILTEAERLIVEEDFPLIPIFQYVQVYLFDPHKVSGISSHPRQQQDLFRVDILGDGKGSDKPLALPPGGGAAKRKPRMQREQQSSKAGKQQTKESEHETRGDASLCCSVGLHISCLPDGGRACSA
jgi:oligopeptide transport system substrate-binding protein